MQVERPVDADSPRRRPITYVGMTLLSYRDWYETGRSREDLDRAFTDGTIRQLRRGVLTNVDPDRKPEAELLLRVVATADHLGEHTAFSHYSAAALHNLPLFAKRLQEVTVIRSAGGHGSVHPTIHARGGELPAGDVTEVAGVPVTSLARTVADLIRLLPFQEAVILLDRALALGVDPADLSVRTRSGRGCRMAARAIAFADGAAESPGESLSRVRMLEAGLVMPTLQHTVRDMFGRFVGRGDFYWEHARTLGEFDGQVKYTELAPQPGDLEAILAAERLREQRITATGVRVVRWTWPELWDGSMASRLRPLVGSR